MRKPKNSLYYQGLLLPSLMHKTDSFCKPLAGRGFPVIENVRNKFTPEALEHFISSSSIPSEWYDMKYQWGKVPGSATYWLCDLEKHLELSEPPLPVKMGRITVLEMCMEQSVHDLNRSKNQQLWLLYCHAMIFHRLILYSHHFLATSVQEWNELWI